ncbi:MAG TPA: PA0069 family radical SAM protein [Gammaproteobacteria bacterium]
MSKNLSSPLRGRGALGNPDNRYAAWQNEAIDDGWGSLDVPVEPLRTTLTRDASKTIISYNSSPDVPFDRSINPYRGCEHGCVYCFARPTHAYLGLSPGLDFETQLFYKPDAASLLRGELDKKSYRPQPVMLGINTDAWQPAERQLGITRQVLEVLQAYRHPVGIVTKSALIERDLDILTEMAQANLVSVAISITTLDRSLSRTLEPRAAAPQRRLEVVRRLADAGIPVGVLVAPLIPVLTDSELETIMEASREAGASYAGYVLLRMPLEIEGLFEQWLRAHAPLKAEHVLSRMRDCHGGKSYDTRFGERMRGNGPYAELIAQRYRSARKKFALDHHAPLDTAQFKRPGDSQLELF